MEKQSGWNIYPVPGVVCSAPGALHPLVLGGVFPPPPEQQHPQGGVQSLLHHHSVRDMLREGAKNTSYCLFDMTTYPTTLAKKSWLIFTTT